VFRFEPSRDYVESSRPEDDDDAVAGWFDTTADPHIAAELRAAEEVARREVPGPEVGLTASLGASTESTETTAPQQSANSSHPPDDEGKSTQKKSTEPPDRNGG
jgi:hypothetical protein